MTLGLNIPVLWMSENHTAFKDNYTNTTKRSDKNTSTSKAVQSV